MKTDLITIRKVDITEVELLTELSIATFCDSYAHVNTKENLEKYLADNMQSSKLQYELEDSNNSFFFAYYNGSIAGYIKLRKGYEPIELFETISIELERIYVLKEYKGKKIGAAFIKYCEKYAIETGCNTLWLGVWEHNANALKFYFHLGFEIFGSHVFLFGNDEQTDLLMKKNIAI